MSLNMKPNSAHPKPAAGGASSDAYSLVPMQHGQDHQQFVGYCRQMPPSGGSSFVHQQLHEHPRRYPGSFHVSPGVPVVHRPTAYLQQQHQQQQQHHHHQQSVQMSSGISPAVYADMVQPSPQPLVTSPAGFSASAVRTTGHQQQLMMAQQQRHGVQPTEVECYDGSTSFPGAHRRYNQQQQQQSCCPMHAFPSSAQYHQPRHVQPLPSTRPPRLTTEAQYFLDPKCTVPFEQPLSQPASTDGCCSNPKCSKRKQS